MERANSYRLFSDLHTYLVACARLFKHQINEKGPHGGKKYLLCSGLLQRPRSVSSQQDIED